MSDVLMYEAAPDGKVKQTSVDGETELDPQYWPLWRKTAPVRASRVPCPFIVETAEGPLRCEDGWIAVDARGYPYPIAADEFEKIYEPAVGSESFVERLEALQADLRKAQQEGWGDPRELAIALTALEDAQMRTARARAKKLLDPVDVTI